LRFPGGCRQKFLQAGYFMGWEMGVNLSAEECCNAVKMSPVERSKNVTMG
jgi:hypothetical protein